MKLVEVLIERKAESLNRPFSYLYYGSKNIDIGFRVIVPFAKTKLVAYVLKVIDTNKSKEELESLTGYKISDIIDVIDDKPLLNKELMQLANKMSEYYLSPLISVLQSMLPTSLKPSFSSLKGPKIAYDSYYVLVDGTEEGLTPKQIELIRKLKSNGPILKRDYKSISIANKLISLGKIEVIKKEKSRLVIPQYEREEAKKLTSEQENAVNEIINNKQTVSLLYGVTGSGKTEVYLKLSELTLKEGMNVLMLVPEISLTPVMVEYFQRRFEGKVAILHSNLTPAEKYDEYRRIAKGETRVVVGVRSAIFAPLENIGLIVLDEEHVESYKQDSSPYYHARDIAIFRAEYYHAKVVLGSATPSLESMARAKRGVYQYVSLPNRINKQDLPKTSIIDLSRPFNLSRDSFIFSKQLIKDINEVLLKKEQAILLINRRGYSGYISCRNCGHMFMCPNCDIALTYHKEDNLLKCHHCGYVELAPHSCPDCGSSYLSYSGFGTERIVKEINKLFPNARTLRLDSDVGEVRNNIAKVIKQFSNHEADILVGTQMIAKGHDFPNVTLVGVVLADIGLSLPSFRSTERTFELITQAVGRSGRSYKEGKAIIQTYNPTHYAISLAAKQDYTSFFKKEMEVRKISQYPPYTYLASLEVSGSSEENVIELIHHVFELIKNQNFENVTVLGPISPYIAKENNTYRRLILVKYKNSDKIKPYLREVLDSLKNKSQINVKINVDPYNF